MLLRIFGVVLLLVVVFIPTNTSAHALLVESTPAQGAILDVAPEQALLVFSEDIEAITASVQVFDDAGIDWGLSQPLVNAAFMTVDLPLNLLPGNYTLVYQVVSLVDGHSSAGSILFSIGTGQAPIENEVIKPAQTSIDSFAVFARALQLIGGIAALGGLIWLVSVVRPLNQRNPAVGMRALNWTIWGIQWGLMGLMIGAGLSLLNRLNSAGGLNIDAFAVVLQRRVGLLELVRVLGAATLMPLVFLTRRSMLAIILTIVMLSGLSLTWSLSGHAAATQNPLFPVFADWMHLLMVAIWLGGVLGLAMLALGLRSNPDLRRSALRYAVPRFSPIALGSIVLIMVTGVFRAFEHMGAWSDLWSTRYGITLLIKLTLMALAFGFGLLHWRRSGPQIVAQTGEQQLSILQAFSRSVSWESGFALAIIVVTSALVQTPPPLLPATSSQSLATMQPSPTPIISQPLTLQAEQADFSITLTIDDQRPGERTFVATIAENGTRITPDRVRLSFTAQDREMGRDLLILEAQPDGSFQGSSYALSIVGSWQIELQVRQVNVPDTTVSWIVEITR